MEEEHNHLVEITPEKISISLDNLSTSFNILNLTLQYVPYKIISPNPMIFHIQPDEGKSLTKIKEFWILVIVLMLK